MMPLHARVEHPEHGKGTVARLLDGGRRALVRFDGSPVLRTLRSIALRQTTPTDPKSAVNREDDEVTNSRDGQRVYRQGKRVRLVPTSTPPRIDAPPGSQLRNSPAAKGAPRARQAIEALRTGVVPSWGLDLLTLGRESEIARFSALLEQQRGLAVLSGDYGQGKSHFLELSAAQSLQRRWLVARASFDPLELPPSQPLRLYAALVRSLVYPDNAGTGLQPLLEAIGDDDEFIHGDKAHRWLSPALFAIHRASPGLAEEVLDFVSGQNRSDHLDLYRRLRRAGYRGPRTLALPDWRTFGQIMAHMLGGVATWARFAGYGGLTVLLDEAEYLDQLPGTSREMAENVLRYLAMASLPREALAFDPRTVYRGGHRVHKAISPVYRKKQPLVVLCAFTPNPQLENVLARLLRDDTYRMELDAIGAPLLPDLAGRIRDLVEVGWPDLQLDAQLDSSIRSAIADACSFGDVTSTRQAARIAVEVWDIYRHFGRDAALEALTP